jgi:hypothetical protein
VNRSSSAWSISPRIGLATAAEVAASGTERRVDRCPSACTCTKHIDGHATEVNRIADIDIRQHVFTLGGTSYLL